MRKTAYTKLDKIWNANILEDFKIDSVLENVKFMGIDGGYKWK